MKQPLKNFALAFVSVATMVLSASVFGQRAFTSIPPSDWAKVVAAANAEGKVVIYGGPAIAVGAQYKAAFSKQYPRIELEYRRLVGAPARIALEQERQSGTDGADAVITPELVWIAEEVLKNSFKAPVGPANANWPAQHIANGVAPLLAAEPFVMAVNTNLVKTPVTGYQDLLKPEFKGKIGIIEPNAEVLMYWYDWLLKTQGVDFLAKIAAQSPRVYVSSLPMTQAAIAGEISFVGFTIPTILGPLIRQGAPMRMVVPNPSIGTSYAGVVVSWSKRPNAAMVFMDFMMSPAGQTSWAGNGEVSSPIGVPGSIDSRTVAAVDLTHYTPEMMKASLARWNSLLKK